MKMVVWSPVYDESNNRVRFDARPVIGIEDIMSDEASPSSSPPGGDRRRRRRLLQQTQGTGNIKSASEWARTLDDYLVDAVYPRSVSLWIGCAGGECVPLDSGALSNARVTGARMGADRKR